MPRYTCPNCQAILEPPQAIAPGKRIRCPDCQHIFVPVPLSDPNEPGYALTLEEPTAKPTPRPTAPKPRPVGKPQPKPVGAAKPPKAPKPKSTLDDEDDDEVYGIKAPEEETEEQKKNKPTFGEVKERWKKSKRPYALSKVTKPGNLLLRIGLFQALFFLAGILRHLIPIVTPIEERKDDNPDSPAVVQEKEKAAQSGKTDTGRRVYTTNEHLLWIGLYGLGLVYSCIIAIGAASMNDLQSIAWGYVAAIMQLIWTLPTLGLYVWTLLDWLDWYYVILPGGGAIFQGLFPGVFVLTALADPDVKAGFAEKKPDTV